MAEDYLAKYRKKQDDKPKDYLAQYRGKSFGQMSNDTKSPEVPAAPELGSKLLKESLSFAARPVVAIGSAFGDVAGQGVGGAIRAARRGVPGINAIGQGGIEAAKRGAEHVASWFGRPLPPQDTRTIDQFREMGYTESPIPPEVAEVGGTPFKIARSLTSPEAAAIAAEYVATLPVDAAMAGVLPAAKPFLSRATEPLRQVPGIKQAGNVFSRGFSIKGAGRREDFRDMVDEELGREALENALLEERLATVNVGQAPAPRPENWFEKRFVPRATVGSELSREERDLIALAIETRTVDALPDHLRPAAETVMRESADQVSGRVAEGLRPNELGAHLDAAEQRALALIADARARNRFAQELAQMEVPTGMGGADPLAGAVDDPILQPDQELRRLLAQPPKRELPSIELTHQPTPEPRALIREIDPEKAAQIRRLEEEGMLPPRIQDSLRKRRGAIEDARQLEREGMAGPEEYGQAAFKSTEVYHPKPRPKFGQPPKPPKPYKPERGLREMFEEGPELPPQPETVGPSPRSVAKAERAARRAEVKARRALREYEDATAGGLGKLPRSGKRGIDIFRAEPYIETAKESRVAFAPSRFLTPKAQRTKSLAGEGRKYGAPTGLSTKLTGQRKYITETTEDVAKSIRAKHPELADDPVFRDVLEGARIAGENNNRAIAHARILKAAAEKFKSTADDAVELGGEKGLKVMSGFTDKMAESLKDIKVDKEVFRALKDLDDALSPQNYGPFQNTWRSANQAWKSLVTVVNPQFGSRNMQWNVLIGFARGNRNPNNWREAASTMGGADDTRTLMGKTYRELREEATENRVIGQGFFTEFAPARSVTGEGKVKSAIKAPARAAGQANRQLEDLSRLSFYIAKRKAGLSAKEAAKEVKHTYFNYSRDAFTAPENFLRGNLVPFYSWMRRIVPLYGRTLFENPSLHVGLSSVQKNLSEATEEDLGLMPDVAENLGLIKKRKPGQKPNERVIQNISGISGFQQVNSILGDRGRGVGRNLLDLAEQSVTPFLGVPAQIAEKRNAFFGSDFTGKPKQLPDAARALAYVPFLRDKITVRDGKVYGPEEIDMALRVRGPLFQAVLDDAPRAALGDRGAEARIMRWLTGTGLSARDLTGARRSLSYRVREQRKKERAQGRDIKRIQKREADRLEREERLLAE